MTVDALDPGPDYTFPNLPRTEDGRLDTTRMPVGVRRQRRQDGTSVLVDVTPTVRLADGQLVPVTAVLAP